MSCPAPTTQPFDTAAAEQLIAKARGAEREWDAADESGDCDNSSQVDGWNDCLDTHARPLAGHLRAAIDEIERLRSEVARLTTQRDEALADGVLSQRACDLENDRAQLRAQVAAMQPLVTAVEAWVDDPELADEVVFDAVAAYRAGQPANPNLGLGPAQRALVRLLWNSQHDDAVCTCYPGDPCPECEAMQALGLGRWPGATRAQELLLTAASKEKT